MKVVMIGQKGIPAIFGGIERHVEELSTCLHRCGVDTVVYCRPWYCPGHEKKVNGVRTVHLPSIKTKHLDAITHTFFATIHAMIFEKPDVYHFHGVGPSLLSWIPRVFASRARVVVTFHSMDRMHDKWGRFARLMLRLGEWSGCRFADRTITVSSALKRYCQEVYGTETTYLPNGFTSFADASPSLLTRWNLVPGRYLLFVGRIIELKGVHTLINAYRHLPATLRETYPLVITGAAQKNQYLRELTCLARGLNVKFTGNQTGATLSALYRYATLFVQPSETESMPIVVLEATGLGLPVVASSIVAHREVLGDNGIYFESKNALDLSLVLNRVLQNIEFERAKAKELGPIIMQKYSWGRIARETIEVYHSTAPIMRNVTVTKEL